ncbi:MAG: hypothetical protein ACOYMB_03240 [Patescibacteria group bacterium]
MNEQVITVIFILSLCTLVFGFLAFYWRIQSVNNRRLYDLESHKNSLLLKLTGDDVFIESYNIAEVIGYIYALPVDSINKSSGFTEKIEKFFYRGIVKSSDGLLLVGGIYKMIHNYEETFSCIYSKDILKKYTEYLEAIFRKVLSQITWDYMAALVVSHIQKTCASPDELTEDELVDSRAGEQIIMAALLKVNSATRQEQIENKFISLSIKKNFSEDVKKLIEAEKIKLFQKYFSLEESDISK